MEKDRFAGFLPGFYLTRGRASQKGRERAASMPSLAFLWISMRAQILSFIRRTRMVRADLFRVFRRSNGERNADGVLNGTT